jgi:hypothetical protein
MSSVITYSILKIYQGSLGLFCAQFGPGGYASTQCIIADTQLINNAQIVNDQDLTIALCKSDFILSSKSYVSTFFGKNILRDMSTAFVCNIKKPIN